MKKRVLSMLLVLVMVLAMLPAAMVMAEEPAAEETVITLDFDADAGKEKLVTAFTLEEDGWEYDADASHDVLPQFFSYASGTEETNWDYSCLRLTQTDYHGTGVLNFVAPEEGTYTMELTYCYGGPGHHTDVTVGGTTTQYFGWSPWGTAPATVVTENVSLEEGANSITLGIREDIESNASYIMVKKIVFTKQPDPTSGLVIDLAAVANDEAALSTYAVAGGDIIKDLGWAIDTNETAPFKNPSQTFLYYVVKATSVNTPVLTDGSYGGVYIATIGGNGGLALNFWVPKTGYYAPTISAVSNTRCGVSEVTVDGVSVGTYDGYGTDAPVISEYTMDEIYLTRGVHKVLIKCTEASPKYSNYAWAYVNEVEFVEICKHTETTSAAVANGNAAHTVTVTCNDCGEVLSAEKAACVDVDENAICDVCDSVISVTYDFNAAYGKGKALAGFTVAEDGWEYDYEASYGGTPVFFMYNSGTEETNWDYHCLRFTQSEVGGTMVLNFVAPADGTYNMDLTYCFGGPGYYTDVTVGGVTGQYFGWSPWGTAPATFSLEELTLTEGVNTITLTTPSENAGSYIMVKDIAFTKQAAPASGLVIDLQAAANDEAALSTYAVTGSEFLKELGWGINTDETAPFKNPSQTFLYYVMKGGAANSPAFADGTIPGVYIATLGGSGGLTLNFNVPEDGYYAPVVTSISNTRCGVDEVTVDGVSVGTYDGYGTDAPVLTERTMDTVYLTKGVHKVMVKGIEASPQYSNYAWAYVNKIEFVAVTVECDHANTTSAIDSNENGTHTVTVTCECGEVISTETVDCVDAGEGKCECGYVMEVPCDHTNTSESVVSNGDKTHTITVTCECGEVVSTETAQCADEDKDTACDACGATLVTITKFAMAGSNMTLGNELVVNVMFMKNKIADEGNTIEITHGDAVTTIAQADWESYNAAMYVARIPVAAKEMADSLTVTVKNADGYEISTAYTTSVREYAGKVLAGALTTYSQEMKNLAVDMLNYGAAAQTNFSYNTGDMANKLLTAEQAGWATADVACTNNQVKGTKCMGSNLSLESKILLNIIFQLTETAAADKYAMVTYTDYTGKAVEYRVDSFNRFNASMQGVVVDEIVLADAFQLVTVTVYNADGSVYGTGSDSVESYAARTTNDLNAAIMKFASSAKTYLSK